MSAVAKDVKDGRDKALEVALKDIEKSCGRGAVMTLDGSGLSNVEVFSSGSLGVDRALGVGGIPRGRIVEIFGPEMSGKTTLTLHLIAEVQKSGGRAAFIDAEHALDPTYAENLGVRTNELLIAQPDCGEQALEITEKLVRSGAVDLIVIDSVAALTPRAEIEAGMDAAQMGLHARLLSKACRVLTGIIGHTNCTVVFINQIRMKIGVMFGSPETTTGGKALLFASSVRIDIRRIGQLKTGEKIVGNRTRIKIVKNKVSPPFRSYECDIIFGRGIYKPSELIDLGVEEGLIEKSGAWYSIDGEMIGQGKSNAGEYLEANPAVADQLEADLRLLIFGAKSSEDEDAESKEDEGVDEDAQ